MEFSMAQPARWAPRSIWDLACARSIFGFRFSIFDWEEDPSPWPSPLSTGAREEEEEEKAAEMAVSKAALSRFQDCLENSREVALRLVQALVSMAWAQASMPVAAATLGGCVAVRVGSRMARRGRALGSPQAIFM